jgi:hypothetical protein
MRRRNGVTSKGIENFGTKHAKHCPVAFGSCIEFLSEGSAREALILLETPTYT